LLVVTAKAILPNVLDVRRERIAAKFAEIQHPQPHPTAPKPGRARAVS
jgi:hypothetical protein